MVSPVPILQPDVYVTTKQFTQWVGFWFCILIPVPISRVLANDHTPSQVLVGSAIGLVEAIFWFFLIRVCASRMQEHDGKRRWGILHDYVLPDKRHEGTVMSLKPVSVQLEQRETEREV